jgi:hypothetical protein
MSATVRDRKLTVRKIAQCIHRTEKAIRRWIWTGQPPDRKLGNGYQVHETDLDAIAPVCRHREPGKPVPSFGGCIERGALELMNARLTPVYR